MSHFYKVDGAKKPLLWYPSKSHFVEIPGIEDFIILDTFKNASRKKIWGNAGASVYDNGPTRWRLEIPFQKWIPWPREWSRNQHKPLVMPKKILQRYSHSNEGGNFSAGAICMHIHVCWDQEYWMKSNMMICSIPEYMSCSVFHLVPVLCSAQYGLFGGGCELSLHSDHIQAMRELYMELVEVGVGLIPSGWRSKEMDP